MRYIFSKSRFNLKLHEKFVFQIVISNISI